MATTHSWRPLGVLLGSSLLALATLGPPAHAGGVTVNAGASVTVGAEKPKSTADDDEATDSLPTFYDQDFSKVAEGSLPKGWTGGDNVLVKQGKERKYLTTAPGLAARTKVTVTSGPISFPQDWRFEWTQNQVSGCDTKLALGDLSVFLGVCWDGGKQTVFKLNDQQKLVAGARAGQRLRYAVEKKGQAVRLLVEGEELLVARVTTLAPTSFTFTLEAEARVLRVRGVDLTVTKEEAATLTPIASTTTAAVDEAALDREVLLAEEEIGLANANGAVRMQFFLATVAKPSWVSSTTRPKPAPGQESLALTVDTKGTRVYQADWLQMSESGDSASTLSVLYRADGSVLRYQRRSDSEGGSEHLVALRAADGGAVCRTGPDPKALGTVSCADAGGWFPVPTQNGKLPTIQSLPTLDQVLGR